VNGISAERCGGHRDRDATHCVSGRVGECNASERRVEENAKDAGVSHPSTRAKEEDIVFAFQEDLGAQL